MIIENNYKKEIVSNLRRKGKKYRKTSKLHKYQSITAPKAMIDQRPDIINNRERLGDFEGDLIKLYGKEVLYTLVDRKSKYTFITYLSNGYADLVNEATIKIFKKLKRKKQKIKSITFDNGTEFSKHDLLSNDLNNLPIYFCFPYHSWEKGTNENTNGLIRQSYSLVFSTFHSEKTSEIPFRTGKKAKQFAFFSQKQISY